MKITRHIAILVLFGLVLSMASSLAAEFASSCDDCCGESACDDCVLCWCCNVVPAVMTPQTSNETIARTIDIIDLPRHPFIESLCYELLDPPPRS